MDLLGVFGRWICTGWFVGNVGSLLVRNEGEIVWNGLVC